MIKIIKEAQVRSEEDNRNLREIVAGIIGEVRGRGDAALREYNEKFDGCTRESLRVSREEIDAAYKELGRAGAGGSESGASQYRGICERAETDRETA